MMRVIGIDLGEARIGVAISGPEGLLAEPLAVLRHRSRDQDIEAIAALVKQHGAEKVVVGLPLRLDGTEGEKAAKARAFARRLERRLATEVALWDERLTTFGAGQIMAGEKPDDRRALIDAVAAAVILQSYLDAQVK